jgi:hypothetical protein
LICATILNIAKIKIKDDTTVMVNNPPNRHKMHGQIGNKGNIRNMKSVRTTNALANNRKRESIDNMNYEMAIRTQRRKMCGMRSHMERSSKIKIPWTST